MVAAAEPNSVVRSAPAFPAFARAVADPRRCTCPAEPDVPAQVARTAPWEWSLIPAPPEPAPRLPAAPAVAPREQAVARAHFRHGHDGNGPVHRTAHGDPPAAQLG